jgi:hypothetical protein
MNRRTTFCRSCRYSVLALWIYPDQGRSAELDMTVNMLIQIDKLVQLIESPVFTCE